MTAPFPTTPVSTATGAHEVVAPGLSGISVPARETSGGGPQVLILAGGLSHERDISLRSGRRVAEALRATGMAVSIHDVDSELLAYLQRHRPSVVWPLLHGAGGEDGSLRDVLALSGVPFVGTGARASRIAWDKPIAKEQLLAAGLATPDWLTLPQDLFRDLGAQGVLTIVVERFGLPVVVKPTRGGSSLGVTRVEKASDLARAMVECFAYGDCALIERGVDGMEIAVSVVDGADGPVALPAVEIVVDGAYDYDAKYNPGRDEVLDPAGVVLGVVVVSTVVILQPDGTAQVLEVSVAPGMTETSSFAQAAMASGHDLGTVYRRIVESALVSRETAAAGS